MATACTVGAAVGNSVAAVGPMVSVGCVVGLALGAVVGIRLGLALGAAVGADDGLPLGAADGDVLGRALGVAVGVEVGASVENSVLQLSWHAVSPCGPRLGVTMFIEQTELHPTVPHPVVQDASQPSCVVP